MKDLFIKYKVAICWLLNLGLTIACACLIFSFMTSNEDYSFEFISSKINLYIFLLNIPALGSNLYNVYSTLRGGKGGKSIGVMVLSFPLLVINLMFLWAGFVLS